MNRYCEWIYWTLWLKDAFMSIRYSNSGKEKLEFLTNFKDNHRNRRCKKKQSLVSQIQLIYLLLTKVIQGDLDLLCHNVVFIGGNGNI